jgi:hypothetical protein
MRKQRGLTQAEVAGLGRGPAVFPDPATLLPCC